VILFHKIPELGEDFNKRLPKLLKSKKKQNQGSLRALPEFQTNPAGSWTKNAFNINRKETREAMRSGV